MSHASHATFAIRIRLLDDVFSTSRPAEITQRCSGQYADADRHRFFIDIE
jgi:hypothetical protein